VLFKNDIENMGEKIEVGRTETKLDLGNP
jgi:hypothetical protein